MNASESNTHESPNFPKAIEVSSPRKWPSAFWIIAWICGLLSLGLFYWSNRNAGDLILIEFQETHGLKVDDSLRYRGTEIGRVEKLELGSQAQSVLVAVRLIPSAGPLASEGAAFWIARPVVSLEAIRGIETIVGPKYIGMEPGMSNAPTRQHFRGLDAPPSLVPNSDSIEIVLDAPTRHGLVAGAPILHRGFRIGDVLQVGLANDARSVSIRCAIDSQYRELVRTNSRFWIRSGWKLDVGITGIKLDADSVSQILNGGVECATPDRASPTAITGQRFSLYEKPEEAWLEWKPSIPYGAVLNQVSSMAPQPYRIAVRWQERSFGFRRDKQRLGWCLIMEDGAILTRNDLVKTPASATAGSASIEVAGVSISLPSEFISNYRLSGSGHEMVKFRPSAELPRDTVRLRNSSLEYLKSTSPIDVAILGPQIVSNLVLDQARLTEEKSIWLINPEVVVSAEMDGCPVASLGDGQIIGFALIEPKRSAIELLVKVE